MKHRDQVVDADLATYSGGTSVCYSIEIFSSVGDPSPRMGYACDSTSVEFVSVYVELVPTTSE